MAGKVRDTPLVRGEEIGAIRWIGYISHLSYSSYLLTLALDKGSCFE
jgi:hypothetical protein